MKLYDISNAPKPIASYSQAVEKKGMLFISGQIPINPLSGELINDCISNETRQVMDNLEALLHEANYTWEDVMKCTIFLKKMDSFEQVNDVYKSYFNNFFPARECVEVSRLPKNVNIEISLIALK